MKKILILLQKQLIPALPISEENGDDSYDEDEMDEDEEDYDFDEDEIEIEEEEGADL